MWSSKVGSEGDFELEVKFPVLSIHSGRTLPFPSFPDSKAICLDSRCVAQLVGVRLFFFSSNSGYTEGFSEGRKT